MDFFFLQIRSYDIEREVSLYKETHLAFIKMDHYWHFFLHFIVQKT